MKIMEALKEDESIRLSTGQKWLAWSNGYWEVYQLRDRGRISSRLIVCTQFEDIAVRYLLGNEND